MNRKALMIAAVVLWMLVVPESASACPDCKGTVGRASQYMVMGYAASILLLLATPLFILTGWTFALAKAVRTPSVIVMNGGAGNAAELGEELKNAVKVCQAGPEPVDKFV